MMKNNPSPPSPAAYARMVKETLDHLNLPIMLETRTADSWQCRGAVNQGDL